MKATINQVIFSLATISWGVVPVYLYASGLIVRYLSPTFHLISLIGGLGMIVLGLFNLLNAKREVGCGHDHGHEHDHDHGHDGEGGHGHEHEHEHPAGDDHDHDHHAQSPVAAICLMILPVLLCTGFTKHEYSTKALTWKGLYKKRSSRASLFSTKREPFTRATIEKTTPKSPEGNYLLTITELYWSAGDQEIMKAYEGLSAQLEGRLIDEDPKLNPDGNRKRLYRVFMTCCAADAQVLGLALEFDGDLPDLAAKTWVKVTGTVGFENKSGQDLAYLKIENLEAAKEPPPDNRFRRGN